MSGAEAMPRRWLALASAALGLSALAAIVLVLARTPILSSPGVAAHFSAALIMHVELATLVWFLAFSAALFGILAGRTDGIPDLLAFLVAAGGVLAVFASPFVAPGAAQLSNYFPVSDSPWFVLGLIVFFAGALIAIAVQAAAIVAGRLRRRTAGRFAPALLWTALPLFIAAASLALSLHALPALDPEIAHEIVSWGPGHLLQSFFVGAMMLAWLWLAESLGWRLPTRGIALPFALVAVPTLAALPIHWLYAVDSPEFRKSFTILMAVSTWPGPLLLLYGWRASLFRGGAESPALRAAMLGSLLLFVAGCLLGAMIRADNTMVPAHYHGTVGAVTLAFIGVTTRLLGLDKQGGRIRAQVWAYGLGFTLMVASLAWTGLLNAPRKSPYSELAAAAGYPIAMALHGIGGLLAVSGTVLFAWSALRALRRQTGFALPAFAAHGEPVEPAALIGRDVRRRALSIALAATLVAGGTISLITQRTSLRATFDRWLAKAPAIDKLSHVAEQRRREVVLRFEQGVAMLQAQQFDFAMTAFHRVLQLSPKMPEAHVNLGFALIGVHEYAAAKDFFESALALRSNQVNAYYGLAVAYEGLGELELALGAMRTYAHLAGKEEPYRIKAESAIWEWGEKLAVARAARPASATDEKAAAGTGGKKK